MTQRWIECGNCYGNGCGVCFGRGSIENEDWADEEADRRYEEYRDRLMEDKYDRDDAS